MPSQLRRHDEPGHIHFWTISCFRRLGFFHHDAIKQVVVDGMRLLQQKFGICLIGYVIMPEHVHVLIFPHPKDSDEPVAVSKLLNAFKQHVGFHAKQCLRTYWQDHGQLWSQPLNHWARCASGRQMIWNTRGHDFNINCRDTLIEKLDYCHKNPITRGLVDRAEDWAYSSYRYYEMDDRAMLTMDWDGGWPIVW
ncbi:MAG: transposase [Phycisphaerae bacterium]|nr:transposase [Phycisphaerae bacterium]